MDKNTGNYSLSPSQRLRTAGLRVTGPRLAILTHLQGDQSHPTAEQIYRSLRTTQPSLSLSTVYQTLDNFIRAGLIRRVTGAGSLLRVDGTGEDHDHAVCRGCGEIFDVDRGWFALPAPPGKLPGGHEVKGLRLEYDVLCQRCGAPEPGQGPQGAGSASGKTADVSETQS